MLSGLFSEGENNKSSKQGKCSYVDSSPDIDRYIMKVRLYNLDFIIGKSSLKALESSYPPLGAVKDHLTSSRGAG